MYFNTILNCDSFEIAKYKFLDIVIALNKRCHSYVNIIYTFEVKTKQILFDLLFVWGHVKYFCAHMCTYLQSCYFVQRNLIFN